MVTRMNRFLLSFALIAVTATARPPVETVHPVALTHTLKLWRHGAGVPFGTATSYSPPQPVRTDGGEPIAGLIRGDVLLWERYTGQPITKGDVFLADYPTKGFTMAARECAKVTASTITTINGTTIPLTQVRGVVRRVVRVSE